MRHVVPISQTYRPQYPPLGSMSSTSSFICLKNAAISLAQMPFTEIIVITVARLNFEKGPFAHRRNHHSKVCFRKPRYATSTAHKAKRMEARKRLQQESLAGVPQRLQRALVAATRGCTSSGVPPAWASGPGPDRLHLRSKLRMRASCRL